MPRRPSLGSRATPPGSPKHFATATAFRRWLERHHGSQTELLVGFYKSAAKRRGMTYPEALDEALCVGWIDGVRRSVDAERYAIRFTPRTLRSYWSAVNIRKAQALVASGRMTAAGLAAFSRRDASAPARYAFENRPAEFPPAYRQTFEAQGTAWSYFAACPPGYRRTCTFWVLSARQEATRQRRLQELITWSAAGRRIPPLATPGRERETPPPKRQRGEP